MALGALALVALVVVLPHYGVMAGAAQLYALGLAFGIFVVIHAYRMLRLRPLLVGLPRSDTRISFQELTSLYAQHLSSRLLGFLTVGSAVGFVAKCGLGFASGRIVNEPFDLVTVAISAMMAVYFGYCLFLKMQFGRRALSSADHPSLFPLREVSAK